MRWRRLPILVAFAAGCGAPVDDDVDVNEIAQGVTVCPDGATTQGIDVSVYQGTIVWQQVKAGGVEFAFIRVSDGLPPIDSRFEANWAGARAAGVLRGAYQFFREDEDPIAQADLLLTTMGALEADDLPPVIDVETTDGQTANAIVANVGAWIDRVAAGSGRRPIIYTGPYFWSTYTGGSSAFADIPLWLAHYTSGCPRVPDGFSKWTFWQYSSTGSVGGITGNVDMDRFNGDDSALQQLIRDSTLEEPDAGLPDAGSPDAAADADPGAACANGACDGAVTGGCSVSGRGGGGAAAAVLLAFLLSRRRPGRSRAAPPRRRAGRPRGRAGAPGVGEIRYSECDVREGA